MRSRSRSSSRTECRAGSASATARGRKEARRGPRRCNGHSVVPPLAVEPSGTTANLPRRPDHGHHHPRPPHASCRHAGVRGQELSTEGSRRAPGHGHPRLIIPTVLPWGNLGGHRWGNLKWPSGIESTRAVEVRYRVSGLVQLASWTDEHDAKAWMFVGSEQAGQRAAAVMSLVQSARLNGHDPYAYLSDVLRRLPTQLNSRIEELLPHRWRCEPADRAST